MMVSGEWLEDPGTQAVCATLTNAGYQALFVGGCVRNALLGLSVADIDISTDATPETVTNLAENAGFHVIPTGIDHGTVTVVARGVPHEITTFRRDVSTDGRRATVAFSASVSEDAKRRDLTINALYATPSGKVIDPLNGLPDLLSRRVRFVGDADARIREDYLRILRFFRFHAIYADPDGGIDPEGLAACAANSAGLETLSRERIGSEMRKLLSAANPAPAVAAMAHSGVLMAVLPGSDGRALATLVHLEGSLPIHWLRRLAILTGEDPTQSLRLSRAETAHFRNVRDEIGTTSGPAELAYRHTAAVATDVILARAALLEMPLPDDWRTEIAKGATAIFPVSAADLIATLQGPALGQRLQQLESRWIASGFKLTRESLLV